MRRGALGTVETTGSREEAVRNKSDIFISTGVSSLVADATGPRPLLISTGRASFRPPQQFSLRRRTDDRLPEREASIGKKERPSSLSPSFRELSGYVTLKRDDVRLEWPLFVSILEAGPREQLSEMSPDQSSEGREPFEAVE